MGLKENRYHIEMGERLRDARKKAGYSQSELAEEMYLAQKQDIEDKMKDKGFKEDEIERYFEGRVDKCLMQKIDKEKIPCLGDELSTSTIGAYENGQTPINYLNTYFWAKACNVSIDSFFDLQSHNINPQNTDRMGAAICEIEKQLSIIRDIHKNRR